MSVYIIFGENPILRVSYANNSHLVRSPFRRCVTRSAVSSSIKAWLPGVCFLVIVHLNLRRIIF